MAKKKIKARAVFLVTPREEDIETAKKTGLTANQWKERIAYGLYDQIRDEGEEYLQDHITEVSAAKWKTIVSRGGC